MSDLGAVVFRNLTPHPLVVFRLDCSVPLCTLKPEPVPFRLPEKDLAVSKVGLAIQHRKVEERSQAINYPDGWSEDGNYYLSIPVVSRQFDDPAALLPPENSGDPDVPWSCLVVWVVSLPALMALRAAGCVRRDVVAPDTGPGPFGAVRDAEGNIVGVRRFVHLMPDSESTFNPGSWEWPAETWNAANPAPPKYPLVNVRPS